VATERHPATEEWRQIARGPRVLYHVLTWPGKDDWTPEEFYDVGRSDWEDFRSQWLHYAGELDGTCLEVGCGAGRLTRQLAEEFDRVEGLDVSADMIERTRAATPDNVVLHQVDGTRVPLPDDSVDAVFSVHVLQHLDGFEDLSSYLAETRRVLAPGGTMMVHIALSSSEGGLFGRRGRLRRELDLWRSRQALKRGREHWAVRYRLYRLEDVQGLLDRLGFERVELRMFPVRSNGYPHTFWFATAPRS
jgi:SAM-dependent methyltransferase